MNDFWYNMAGSDKAWIVLLLGALTVIAIAWVVVNIADAISDVRQAKYESLCNTTKFQTVCDAEKQIEHMTEEEWKQELIKYSIWLRSNKVNVPQDARPVVIEYLDWLQQ